MERPIREEARVGDAVVARDGAVGRVEHIVRTNDSDPAYLVVSAPDRFRRRHPVVPWALVRRVDRARGTIHVQGRRHPLRRLPESLPLVV